MTETAVAGMGLGIIMIGMIALRLLAIAAEERR